MRKGIYVSIIPFVLCGFALFDNYNESNSTGNIELVDTNYEFQSSKQKYDKLFETGLKLQQARIEEEKRKIEEEERKRIEEEEKFRRLYQEVDFILTFYTTLPDENGGYTTTAWGEPLTYGMVASNYYDKDTKILLEGYGEFRVADRGGSNFDHYNRLDVAIPRIDGESDYEYKQRVLNLGVVRTKGYIYKGE